MATESVEIRDGAAYELTAERHCAHPGCGESFDMSAVMNGDARADGWLQYKQHSTYYCPAHNDSLVVVAYRRLFHKYGPELHHVLQHQDSAWSDEDLRDWLTCCPTMSGVWRRMAVEVLARLDGAGSR